MRTANCSGWWSSVLRASIASWNKATVWLDAQSVPWPSPSVRLVSTPARELLAYLARKRNVTKASRCARKKLLNSKSPAGMWSRSSVPPMPACDGVWELDDAENWSCSDCGCGGPFDHGEWIVLRATAPLRRRRRTGVTDRVLRVFGLRLNLFFTRQKLQTDWDQSHLPGM